VRHYVQRHLDVCLAQPIFANVWLERPEGQRVHEHRNGTAVLLDVAREFVEHIFSLLFVGCVHVKEERSPASGLDCRFDFLDVFETGLAIEMHASYVVAGLSKRFHTRLPEATGCTKNKCPARCRRLCVRHESLQWESVSGVQNSNRGS